LQFTSAPQLFIATSSEKLWATEQCLLKKKFPIYSRLWCF